MNASEFAFLAVGLILGVASGAALVVVLRARPPAPREVRVTVAPDAIPRRRGTTLAQDAFAMEMPEPARGGPADHGLYDPDDAWRAPRYRTTVRSGGADGGRPVAPSRPAPAAGAAAIAIAGTSADMVGFRVEPGRDPMFQAMRDAGAGTGVVSPLGTVEPTVGRAPSSDDAPAPAQVGTAVAVLEAEELNVTQAQDLAGPGRDDDRGLLAPPSADGPCAEARQVATERCDLAVRARAGVGVADETLRAAQRAHDIHLSKADAAAAASDPATVRREKEAAQAAFREARSSAGSPETIEAAARDWLGEINRINTVVRDAAAVAAKEREAAAAIAPALERLALEADGARIKAEAAEAACLAARQAVADCVEAQRIDEPAALPPPPQGSEAAESWEPGPRPSGPRPVETQGEPLRAAFGAGQEPVIFRLLRGDDAAMTRTTARLADDPAEQRRWRASLAELVDAIIAVSIGQAALDFPADHPFWGPFTRDQDRDIVAALSSMGFRFDGMGGWTEDRVPSQRDLSMALGYAGLDPMRIRRWPAEPEMRELFADVSVAADEHLAGAAGELTLGELVAMLGRRADGLAMLWNDWGRVRPLLLEDA